MEKVIAILCSLKTVSHGDLMVCGFRFEAIRKSIHFHRFLLRTLKMRLYLFECTPKWMHMGIFFLITTPYVQLSAQTTWETVVTTDGSEPIPRHEAAFVRVKDKFYLLGGRGIRPVSIYETMTQKWSTGSAPPLEIHHFQPVVYNDKVYVIGAMTGGYPGEKPVANIYSYDTKYDRWEKGPLIPSDRLRGSTGNVLLGDTVFMTCGIKDGHKGDHKTWLDTYNLKTGKWAILSDAPRARDHFQAAAMDRKIYLLGGRRSMAPKETFVHTVAEIDVYDIERDSWRTLSALLPTPRAGNMVIAHKNKIWVVGGESENQKVAHKEVEVLNTDTEKFERYPNLIRGRHGTGLIHYKDAIYTASGSGNKGGAPELTQMEKIITKEIK